MKLFLKPMQQFIFVILLLLLVQGCTSTRKVMDSWLGNHKSELIRSWSPPTYVTSDGNIDICISNAIFNVKKGADLIRVCMREVNSVIAQSHRVYPPDVPITDQHRPADHWQGCFWLMTRPLRQGSVRGHKPESAPGGAGESACRVHV